MYKKKNFVVFSLIVFVLVCGVATGFFWWQAQREATRRIEFIIPPGTSDRIAAGQELNVLPATITMTLGLQDVLVIRNEDTKSVVIGPYKIEPRQQFTQQYFNPGVFDLVCTIHGDQRMRIIVTRS